MAELSTFLAYQCLSASMQYLFLSMQVPLTHLSPVWKRLSVHRCTPKAVIYSFLYFYKFCLTLNLAQTTVTSEKCVKGSRLCLQLQSTEYSKYHCRTHLPTLTSVVNEVQAKILQQVALYISCTTQFQNRDFTCRENFHLGMSCQSAQQHAPQSGACVVSKGSTLGLSVKTAASHSRDKVLK